MLQFVIGAVQRVPSSPPAPAEASSEQYVVSVSPQQTYPSHPQLSNARFTISRDRLQPLLEMWALQQPSQLTSRCFAVPHSCADTREAVSYLLRVSEHLAWGGPMYLTYIAAALAALRCPALDAAELACLRKLFFDDADVPRREAFDQLAATVHECSGGTVHLEEATADEFVTNPPKPVAYLCLSRETERRWLLLRTDRHPPFVFDEDATQEDRSVPVPQGIICGGSAAERLIDLYNDRYTEIFAAAKQKQRDAALHMDVVSFFDRSAGFVFHGLEFGPDGKLPSDGVLQNLDRMRSERKLELLHQGLQELLEFLLFAATESLDRAVEQALRASIEQMIAEDDGGAGDPSELWLDPVDLASVLLPQDPSDLSNPLVPPSGDPPSPEDPSVRITVVQPTPLEVREIEEAATFCRTEATLAFDAFERVLRHDNEHETALQCREHIATVQSSLERLERLLRCLRKG